MRSRNGKEPRRSCVGSASASTLGRGRRLRDSRRGRPTGYSETEPQIAAIGVRVRRLRDVARRPALGRLPLARSAEATLRIIGVHEQVPVDRFALTNGLSSPAFSAVVREQQEKRLAIGAAEFGDGLDVEPQLCGREDRRCPCRCVG